jgi:hypothetical protein
MAQKFLTRKEAAQRLQERGLRIGAGTLARYACDGVGPRFSHWGRVAMYDPDEIDRWAAERLGEASTHTLPRDRASSTREEAAPAT